MNKLFLGFLIILLTLFFIWVYIIINWNTDNSDIYDEDISSLYLNNFTDEKNIPSQQDE